MIVTITLLLLFDSDDAVNFSDIVRVTWHYIGVRSLLISWMVVGDHQSPVVPPYSDLSVSVDLLL